MLAFSQIDMVNVFIRVWRRDCVALLHVVSHVHVGANGNSRLYISIPFGFLCVHVVQ